MVVREEANGRLVVAFMDPVAVLQMTSEREIAPGLTPSASTLTERLERFVVSTTKQLAARIAAAS